MDFIAAARAWCAVIESRPDGRQTAEVAAALARLYAAGFHIPVVPWSNVDEDDDDHDDEPEVAAPAGWTGLDIQSYPTMIDVLDLQSEPGMGDLTDDLVDIYLDVKRGLLLHDAGRPGAASHHWRLTCRGHWGHHAVAALGVLQAVLAR